MAAHKIHLYIPAAREYFLLRGAFFHPLHYKKAKNTAVVVNTAPEKNFFGFAEFMTAKKKKVKKHKG